MHRSSEETDEILASVTAEPGQTASAILELPKSIPTSSPDSISSWFGVYLCIATPLVTEAEVARLDNLASGETRLSVNVTELQARNVAVQRVVVAPDGKCRHFWQNTIRRHDFRSGLTSLSQLGLVVRATE
ncbi:unnamed protein product [Protopolystoma xenopodis]|uniref:Uncharacterized protein n=1 Tax=Protopolystoma xenopodis TaxID=117903 RepID=A0A448XI71_9PLAT|nr:unnamed protein product [Protopolystoma xenopodis]